VFKDFSMISDGLQRREKEKKDSRGMKACEKCALE
jgi:hypothetical protein